MKISQHTVRDVFDFSSVGLHLYLTFIWNKKISLGRCRRTRRVQSRHHAHCHCPQTFAKVFWFQVLSVYRGNALQCCWFKVHGEVEVQNWLRDTNGMQKNLEMFFQKRKNKDRERHWRSCFWPLFSSGCSSPSGKSAITFLTYRMWNERASCPSVHFLLLIRDSPPGAGLTRYVIPSVCFGPASRVFGQIDVPGTSLEGVGGGEGLQSGNRSDFPTPPQGAVVVLQAHSVSVPREKLYFCCFVSAALSFGSLVSIGGGGYVGMDIYLFHLNKWSNALILSIAYFFFFSFTGD